MGNCANKPLTKEEGAPAPVEKPADAAAEREMAVDEDKVISSTADADDPTKPQSLAQMLEEEEKKPAEDKAAEPMKEVEIKKEETPNALAKIVVSEPSKKEETKPAETPAALAVAVAKEPEDQSTDKKVEEKNPEAK